MTGRYADRTNITESLVKHTCADTMKILWQTRVQDETKGICQEWQTSKSHTQHTISSVTLKWKDFKEVFKDSAKRTYQKTHKYTTSLHAAKFTKQSTLIRRK